MLVEPGLLDEQVDSWITSFRASGFECDADLRRDVHDAAHRALHRGETFERSVAVGLKLLARSISGA